MKSNWNTGPVNMNKLRRETQAVAERLVKEREKAIIDAVQDSVMTQTLAVTFWILHRDFGFGKKRMNRLKDLIEDEFMLMVKKPLGKQYSPIDIREWLRTQYAVDFTETRYGEEAYK